MLTNEMRPQTLDEVYGQTSAIAILKSFAKNPEPAPKCLLLHGPYGTGKTSASLAFVYAVNNITTPDEIRRYLTVYNCASLEYDANNNRMSVEKYLDERLGYAVNKWEVVILDEIQGASISVQTNMLNVIELENKNRFFIFCTTELERVLPTLRSRCMPIRFQSISYNDVYKNIDDYDKKKGLNIPDSIKSHIATRCNGHMRDAHMELNKYLCVGGENYIANATSYYRLIADMFIAAYKGDKDSLVKSLRELSFNPLYTIKQEFDSFILDCANAKYLGQKSHLNEVNSLLDEYGDNFTYIVDFYAGIWDNSLFSSDRHFYMHMLSFFKDLEKKRITHNEP